MKNPKQTDFIRMRAVENKSLINIAGELDVDINEIMQWEKKLQPEIINMKAIEYDKIIESKDIGSIHRFNSLCDTYKRLHAELDKRDFTGLPTDKLYDIMNDAYALIEEIKSASK